METTYKQRVEELEQRTNLRNFGGYRTSDGRTIKPNLLFRSAELAVMNEEDIAYLQENGLRYICDFRSEGEQKAKPNPVVDGAENIPISVFGGVVNAQEMITWIKNMDIAELNRDLLGNAYVQFVTDPIAQAAYRRFFDLVLQAEGSPLLWHCAAGKDRTGFAGAILLLALEVPMETVMEDFLRSNNNRKEAIEHLLSSIQEKLGDDNKLAKVREMMAVKQEYLTTALHAIIENYGTMETYMEEVLGLTFEAREKLKSIYLE
ncbi:tyrosine-protein phosphatase [Paenibacillus aceris]|uniref:Protein-tyrosine phosphatase n=1 Tax=Paenibacillus aceris TaxID=869555 RepID=A0ABS4HX15_9BACL|nr:tyrosine-protein phosphatase [Paenibacillus aceris]MBP1963035.1 protein-tyrosine phosphatase [Paenibacillus aceris]NHW38449.1 tyrosine-protein phosphatase [Paenibacillus aceris]